MYPALLREGYSYRGQLSNTRQTEIGADHFLQAYDDPPDKMDS